MTWNSKPSPPPMDDDCCCCDCCWLTLAGAPPLCEWTELGPVVAGWLPGPPPIGAEGVPPLTPPPPPLNAGDCFISLGPLSPVPLSSEWSCPPPPLFGFLRLSPPMLLLESPLAAPLLFMALAPAGTLAGPPAPRGVPPPPSWWLTNLI